MSRTYTPGPEADAIVQLQLAKGCFRSAEEVIAVGLQLLEQSEAEMEALSRLIDEAIAADAARDDGGECGSPEPERKFLPDRRRRALEA